MKYLVLSLLLSLGSGCVASEVKTSISYQAARCDRAVALINSGGISQKQEEDYIRGMRSLLHSYDYSINGNPLPADLVPEVKGN